MTTVYVTEDRLEHLAFQHGTPIELSADRAFLFLEEVTYTAHLKPVTS